MLDFLIAWSWDGMRKVLAGYGIYTMQYPVLHVEREYLWAFCSKISIYASVAHGGATMPYGTTWHFRDCSFLHMPAEHPKAPIRRSY